MPGITNSVILFKIHNFKNAKRLRYSKNKKGVLQSNITERPETNYPSNY